MDEPTQRTEQAVADEQPAAVDEQLAEDVLVEEVSIDGMCGVY